MRAAAVLVWLSLLAVARPATARELWERPWIEVGTQHFTLSSALDEERTVALARDLENFRRAAELVTNIGRFEERIPTHVYVLPHRVGELGLTYDAAGYLVATMRANHAVITPVPGMHIAEVLRHEYVHFLVHNRDRLNYPTWYDEGFAELLSTLRVKDGVLMYGRAPEGRLESISSDDDDWMGFEPLLETRDTSQLSSPRKQKFYAQSWLLVHYLTLGRKGQDLTAQSTRFLALSEAGTSPRDAFEQAFDLKVKSLARLLRRHASRLPYYKLELKKPLVDVNASVTAIPGAAVAARLADLSLARGDVEQAGRYADAALALDPDNTRALVVRADVHKAAGRFAEAEPLYRRAIAHEPENALHELDFGEYFLTRAELEQAPERARAHRVEARRHFARSHRVDPENPETLAVNGASYLGEGEPGAAEKAVASLEAAHERLPSHPQIKLLLARAYLAAHRPDAARPLLGAVLAWADSTSAGEAGELLASLEAQASP